MTSLFYNELTRRFPVPLLAIEWYGSHVHETMTAGERSVIFSETLIRICKIRTPTDEDRTYLLKRFNELESPQESVGARQKKTFGSSFNDYLKKSDTTQLLGLMTNYDIPKMRELYCVVDHVDAKALIANFVASLVERNVIQYESALYGSGGSYKGDSGGSNGNTKEWDMNTTAGEVALAQFGIGTLSADALAGMGINLDG